MHILKKIQSKGGISILTDRGHFFFFSMPEMEALSILTAAVFYLGKAILLHRYYCNVITVMSRTAMRR